MVSGPRNVGNQLRAELGNWYAHQFFDALLIIILIVFVVNLSIHLFAAETPGIGIDTLSCRGQLYDAWQTLGVDDLPRRRDERYQGLVAVKQVLA